MATYTIVIEVDEEDPGWLLGRCIEKPNAFTQGRTREEVIKNMREVIPLLIETERELAMIELAADADVVKVVA